MGVPWHICPTVALYAEKPSWLKIGQAKDLWRIEAPRAAVDLLMASLGVPTCACDEFGFSMYP
jgi:hypothetical protein